MPEIFSNLPEIFPKTEGVRLDLIAVLPKIDIKFHLFKISRRFLAVIFPKIDLEFPHEEYHSMRILKDQDINSKEKHSKRIKKPDHKLHNGL